jgi:hypothetical protein
VSGPGLQLKRERAPAQAREPFVEPGVQDQVAGN